MTCRNLGGIMSQDADFLVFESSHFRNGFMYKQFGTNAIVRKTNLSCPSCSNNNFDFDDCDFMFVQIRYMKELNQRWESWRNLRLHQKKLK